MKRSQVKRGVAIMILIGAFSVPLLVILHRNTGPETATATQELPHLVYAPLPMENPAATVADNTPLVQKLQDLTGLHIQIRHYSGYAEIIQRFADGEIDLAYLGPLPVIALRRSLPEAKPIVAFREPDGTARYRCVLVAPYDRDISGTDVDATGQIALTQPLSTCGYVATSWLLRRRGIPVAPDAGIYLGNHEAVALAIARSEFPVGGMKDAIAGRYEGLGVQVIDRTEPLPGFAIVANGLTMTPIQIAAVQTALLEMNDDELELLDLGKYGFERIDETAYRGVVELLTETGVSVSTEGLVTW